MGADAAGLVAFGAEVKAAVAFIVQASGPEPATVVEDLNVAPEAFLFGALAIEIGREVSSHERV